MWSVLFYINEDGTSPVRDFLTSLDVKTQSRFAWSIEKLQERNIRAREPLVRHLEGQLWELREESNKGIYVLIYSFLPDQRIIFLHGFRKNAQETPRHEIEIALKRYDL